MLNVFTLFMFLFIWLAGASFWFALGITVPAYLFVFFTQGDALYDYYRHSDRTEDLETELLEAQLEELERLEGQESENPFSYFDLNANCSRENLNKAFKQKIKKYHPDSVATLGPELKELAEHKTKEIIEMYEKCVELLRKNQAS